MSKDATQTSSVKPDASTQQYQDIFRKVIAGELGNLTGNDSLKQYAGAYGAGSLGLPDYAAGRTQLQNDFQRQRGEATLQGNDLATKEGAFGGSRSAVLNSNLQGDVNRNEASTLTNYDMNAKQQQFQMLAQLLGLGGQGFGQAGYTQSQTMPGNPWAGILGIGTTAAGLGWTPFGK